MFSKESVFQQYGGDYLFKIPIKNFIKRKCKKVNKCILLLIPQAKGGML